jgi:uroporphyrinogen-III decarboxylase
MTHKEQMLAAVEGRPTDRIPWAPRLDLWYNANKRAGTLPSRYRNATLAELVDDLGVGFHAVVPNFQDLRRPEDDADRPLGIYNLKAMPYGTHFENVRRTIRQEGDRKIVEYATPAGDLRTVTLHDERMRAAGITITHVEEYAFKSAEDYAALGHLFENARVLPNYDGYQEFADRVGDRGLAVGFVSAAASPRHLLQREAMPLERFFLETYDHPDELHQLAQRMQTYWNQALEVAAQSPAEVLLLGANYDSRVQYPPFFAEHLQPGLEAFAEKLHANGKYLLTHTDGENTGLLQHYLDSSFDIADSVCPAPMTKLTFREVREAFAGRITIMGGIPAVVLLKESMSDRDFDAFLDDFFEQLGGGDHLILGISDTTPPSADFERLLRIGQRVEEFGPVP